MAIIGTPPPQESDNLIHIERFPQPKYIDFVRWLPPVSALDRHYLLSLFDTDTSTPSLEIHSISTQSLHSSWTPPSRITSLKTTQSHQTNKSIVATSTFSGSLHFLFTDPISASFDSEVSIGIEGECVDLQEGGGGECVCVGEGGKVSVVSFGGERLSEKRVFDSQGLVSYTAVKWASPYEFCTGGLGFGLQWWDQRKPGGAVSQFKGNVAQYSSSGVVHSIDIHPSRKHTCLAGGSSGTVFAWDLRWQQHPIILSGLGTGEAAAHSPSVSEVWEIQYDCYRPPSNTGNTSSSRILPAMICSEDGILAVVEQGEQPIVLLEEPCAINSLDIDKHNPSDVICSLEWESIVILSRT